jgi:hypothetical protein
MATLTTNAASVSMFAGATKVRVRTVDGQVQLRPTDRASAVNLPKGEALATLRPKTSSSSRITVAGDALKVGSKYALQAAKYGWLKLVEVDAIDGAGVSIAAK